MGSACQALDEFSEAREKYHQAAQALGGIWEVVQASLILYMGETKGQQNSRYTGTGIWAPKPCRHEPLGAIAQAGEAGARCVTPPRCQSS